MLYATIRSPVFKVEESLNPCNLFTNKGQLSKTIQLTERQTGTFAFMLSMLLLILEWMLEQEKYLTHHLADSLGFLMKR